MCDLLSLSRDSVARILAIIVLRERVTRWQALGMVLAAVSVSMIAAT